MLFIKHTGTFEDNDLAITCEDIYPMDLGTSGWTEFKMSEDVAAYMAENIELFDCETGLVHSHHTLGAFFSNQDNLMLQQEGDDTNCFVSLVVDTRGQYVARITRKVQTKSEVTVKKLGTSYEFFGEGTKEITHEDAQTTKTIDKEIIEYFDLDVERHEVNNDLDYLDARFEEIERKKSSNRFSATTSLSEWVYGTKGAQPKEQNLFGDNDYATKELTPADEQRIAEAAMEWQPDAKAIHKAVVQMVTCSLILNPDKIDFKQWVKKHMVNMYKSIFGNNCEELAIGQSDCYISNPFNNYKDFIVEFMINNVDSSTAPDALQKDWDVIYSRIASAMYSELQTYEKDNVFIAAYMDALTCYMIE